MTTTPTRTRPRAHPLTRGLVTALALAALAPGAWAQDANADTETDTIASVFSRRVLDNQTADVGPGSSPEQWTLLNASHLSITDATADDIEASGTSSIVLERAFVQSDFGASLPTPAIRLWEDASLRADNTTIVGSVSLIGDNTTAELANGAILIDAGFLPPTHSGSIGLTLSHSPAGSGVRNPYARLDNMLVQVDHAPSGTALSSGIGVRAMFGHLDIINGSTILAAGTAAQLLGLVNPRSRVSMNIDNSTLQSLGGAAIHVLANEETNYDISVANGSHLTGADGNLLLVSSLIPSWAGRTNVQFTVDDARLVGNVTLDRTSVTKGTVDVALRNNARIDGTFSHVTTASIDTGSAWLLTGDSTVGQLTLGSTGTVALGSGTTFNTLSVDTFTGNGGTLAFNTVLGDDTSATDKLIISGDANGQANVAVQNAGGAGAQTSKGIELIRIGGASNAQFDLVGRAVGGSYEYFLFKDASDGGWYLRSQMATAPDPCVADPNLPGCKPIIDPIDPEDPVRPIDPIPVLRPEVGAYLANQFAMGQLLRHTWRDRQGDAHNDEGVRGWARVDGTQSRLSAVEDQLDLRVERSRLQLGADIGVFDNGRGRVGVMGTAAQSSATSRSELTGYSARGKVEGGALGLYGNWASEAMYLDASVQRGQFRNRVQGEGLAEERYDSALWQSSLEAGYRFNIGQVGSTAVSLQPELQLVYTDAHIDHHVETNGTVVRSLGDSGLSGRAGLRLQGEGRSVVGASVSPYLVANWYRDGAGNGMAFDEQALTASVPRNRYELNGGARVNFSNGVSGSAGLGLIRGDHGYREATANVSLSYTW